MSTSRRKWLLANALMTELNNRDIDPELMAIAAALAKECGFVMPKERAPAGISLLVARRRGTG